MEPEKSTHGATVGLIVILIILILGGIYVWRAKMKDALENRNQGTAVDAELDIE